MTSFLAINIAEFPHKNPEGLSLAFVATYTCKYIITLHPHSCLYLTEYANSLDIDWVYHSLRRPCLQYGSLGQAIQAGTESLQ